MKIRILHKDEGHVRYMLGQVPHWLIETDPRPAREQLNERYRFGGWQPLSGCKLLDAATGVYKYPGDPPQKPIAVIEFRDEKIFAYPSEFWGILRADGAFEVARMD